MVLKVSSENGLLYPDRRAQSQKVRQKSYTNVVGNLDCSELPPTVKIGHDAAHCNL